MANLPILNKERSLCWYKNDKLHREDGPAVIYENGSQEWYFNGELHRDNDAPIQNVTILPSPGSNRQALPNSIYVNNDDLIQTSKVRKQTYNTSLSSDLKESILLNDNPAVIHMDGYKAWYKNGKLHRECGPAVMFRHRYEWYKHGVKIEGPPTLGRNNDILVTDTEWHKNVELYKKMLLNAVDCPSKITTTDKATTISTTNTITKDDEPVTNTMCKIVTDDDGTKRYYFNDLLHSECDNCPAVIFKNGRELYYKHGKIHRDGGPAIEYNDTYQEWYRDGKLHRDGGPAIINEDLQSWYSDGKLHRDDGPAIIYKDGTQDWYRYDELHRVDGPAVIKKDGTQEWYIHNKLHRVEGPAVIRKDGTQKWYIHNNFHRIDGPAVIDNDGNQFWYKNNKLHRENGPAVIRITGTQEWYIDDLRHRDDGPAIIDKNHELSWYRHGTLYRIDGVGTWIIPDNQVSN